MGRGTVGKTPVIGATERNGNVRAIVAENTSKEIIHSFVTENIVEGSYLYTDEHPSYNGLTAYNHESVNHHTGEYVRGNIHTNGIESFWSMFKRGHYGVFHHFSNKHLPRYVAEFDMRWNMRKEKQQERLDSMLEFVSGLRLTYKRLIK